MNWIIEENGFKPENIATNGNKFMIGNGYFGYRGVAEEFTKEHFPATIVAGIYDTVGTGWREPINVPNGLYTRLYCDGKEMRLPESEIVSHRQALDMRTATHHRNTLFKLGDGGTIQVSTERVASAVQLHVMAMKYEFICSHPHTITIETGIDGDIWDINGPHLENYRFHEESNGIVTLRVTTHEQKKTVVVAEAIDADFGLQPVQAGSKSYLRKLTVNCEPEKVYTFTKYVSIYTSNDEVHDPYTSAVETSRLAREQGYDAIHRAHAMKWAEKWTDVYVEIEGDEVAHQALNYSIYQLMIIAPEHSEKVSIPARGLSGQVYKGAVFWDTEMFMLPFYLYTSPALARNLVMYRIHTLEGARRKAVEYGFRGAFYAWESQDTGDDACTLFNITDVFTGRPMRTYFRDKQIHISGDVAMGIWQYYLVTGDETVLLDGGAEVILECARFFCSYSYYREDTQRYELLDVTGPDEYHERVHNNAFTNYMVSHVLDIAICTIQLLEQYPEVLESLVDKLQYSEDISRINKMREQLYLPQPDSNTELIEQFDGYFKLEDVTLSDLKKRMQNKNEYLGGGNGLATTTQILKQADVVLMLHLFRDRFNEHTIRANWDFYETRTEHGSSLSPCVYALVAAHIGYSEYAYRYFLKTATIDLTGESKQFVGNLYIGGTHPAANGGAWQAAIHGFSGFSYKDDTITIDPALPLKWTALRFSFYVLGQRYSASIDKQKVIITSQVNNTREQRFAILGTSIVCQPGATLEIKKI
ncbi:MAG: glycoside hydrolase family 65 protein [Candidatus Cohnella colombiensis]|uniref:Glycoside hydrolase family 65 protein n=1 Tax=Candidatus Cohnella colombiensis TaxID=3121368 RepID=A0AA95J9E3_9BACL|nr:MAG: glycoside hydrolase family 65 protein [Cohnella sp.]